MESIDSELSLSTIAVPYQPDLTRQQQQQQQQQASCGEI
jgi:hypothetical protein